VYSAFSKGVVDGIWSSISIWELAFLVAFAAIFVAFMLWLTKKVSEKLGFKRADTVAIEFCGSKKSLATGLPMASVIFASGGTSLGLLILPLMIYHQGPVNDVFVAGIPLRPACHHIATLRPYGKLPIRTN